MARKSTRRTGRGSLQKYSTKKGERWRWQIYVPKDPARPHLGETRVGKAGYLTMRAAEDDMNVAIKKRSTGSRFTKDIPTLEEYGHAWVNSRRLGESTIAGYKRLLRLHIVPYIGTLPIDKIRAIDLASLYQKLEVSGNKEPGKIGDPLSPNTVRKVHTLISSILSAAEDEHLVPANVARSKTANPPTPRQVRSAKPEIVTWTADQVNTFMAWAKTHHPDLFFAWFTMSRTGMRRGEILGLQWQDIDFVNHTIAVRRNRVLVKDPTGERTITKLPKGDKTRVIDVDDDTLDVIKSWRTVIGKIGIQYIQKNAFITVMPATGQPRHPERLSTRFNNAVKQCQRKYPELPTISIHDLRHTHATLLLQAGVHPKIVQERLGHANISITMDTYSHALPTMQKAAVEALNKLLG